MQIYKIIIEFQTHGNKSVDTAGHSACSMRSDTSGIKR